MQLKVIGAGLGRTGTTSLKEALTHLLGGQCFHFLEYRDHPQLQERWLAFTEKTPMWSAVQSTETVPISQWESLMPGYLACVDEPAAYYWKQLWAVFPDALVILTIRDSESWWESVSAITQQLLDERRQLEKLSEHRRNYLEFLFTLYPDIGETSRQEGIDYFEQHNQQVLDFAQQIPEFRKRLLVWQAADGWDPICNALNLPVPDIPFPHSNRRGEFHGY